VGDRALTLAVREAASKQRGLIAADLIIWACQVLDLRRPQLGQPVGQELAVALVHIGASAQEDDGLSCNVAGTICDGAGRWQTSQFPQALLAGGEVRDIHLVYAALVVAVAELLEPDVAAVPEPACPELVEGVEGSPRRSAKAEPFHCGAHRERGTMRTSTRMASRQSRMVSTSSISQPL
jgi:hypothetical protein